jgi:6-pyruvoyl-tetrahydropterin synthase
MASRSLRAADHSAEQLGDIVQLRIVGDTFGYTYITRDCKLRRMSDNCKLFVDQGEYQGLSAVEGINAVTEADLDHLIYEFETHIHDLLLNSYGPVYDIDNDGRVSILISPVYSKLNFAGLFNSNNFANNSNSNLRDLISLFSPEVAKKWSRERWREATRETIAHEMQHLVNSSANLYFNNVGAMEEEWLDESLSVGVEARYRLRRGSPLIENRFTLWAQSPSNVGLLNFSLALSQYGMVGLFNFFLYEQSDDATIKSMVNSTVLGKNNVDRLFSAKGGLNGMFKTWAMAALMDTLSKQGAVNLSQINASYKYQNAIGLDVKYTSVNFGYKTDVLTLPAYGAAFYVLEQPASFGQNEYRFRIESEEGKNIDIVMVRLP